MASSFSDPDFPNNLLTSLHETFLRTLNDVQNTIHAPKVRYWLRLVVIVAGYIMVRPLIEMIFRKLFDRQVAREEAKKKEQEEKGEAIFREKGVSKENITKSKRAANMLRSADGAVGKVLGEVDSEGEREFNEGQATGVSSKHGKNARKRQKHHLKNMEKREAERKDVPQMTEQELMELLDWSESGEEGLDDK